MRLLLDTHFLIWLATDRDLITPSEMAIIDGGNELLVSLLTIWELRLKWRKSQRQGRPHSLIRPDQALSFIERGPISLVLLDGDDLAAVLKPPIDHADPFDEMLLVHAQRLGARLLTRDRDLLGHPLALQL